MLSLHFDNLFTGIFSHRATHVTLFLLCVALYCRIRRQLSRLNHFPGPFWAGITNFTRLYWVKTGRSQEFYAEAHAQYGEYVRLGPNMISISDPSAIQSIYPIRPGFPKGNFYRSMMPYTRKARALPLVFNTRDEKLHKQLKTPIASLYSLSNILTFEVFVDEALGIFFSQLDKLSKQDAFDLGRWLQFFAFDVMGIMSFSEQYGFLENGIDHTGLLDAIWNFMKNAAPMTQMPWLDLLFNKNPLVALFRSTPTRPILAVVMQKIHHHQEELKQNRESDTESTVNEHDFLSRFLDIQRTKPLVPSWAVTAWTFSNVIAGSDTTAVAMKALWYNLLQNQRTREKLYTEILQARQDSQLSYPFPAWSEVSNLPYLNACVNEALRLHPPFCLAFERVVPQEGISVGSHFIPGGTIVGMNPWLINRNRPTFGEDADVWRPERWLGEAHGTGKMEQTLMSFGAGRRVCLGKHIALLELKKLTSALLLNFELNIVKPEGFRAQNYFLFRQEGLMANINRRR